MLHSGVQSCHYELWDQRLWNVNTFNRTLSAKRHYHQKYIIIKKTLSSQAPLSHILSKWKEISWVWHFHKCHKNRGRGLLHPLRYMGRLATYILYHVHSENHIMFSRTPSHCCHNLHAEIKVLTFWQLLSHHLVRTGSSPGLVIKAWVTWQSLCLVWRGLAWCLTMPGLRPDSSLGLTWCMPCICDVNPDTLNSHLPNDQNLLCTFVTIFILFIIPITKLYFSALKPRKVFLIIPLRRTQSKPFSIC